MRKLRVISFIALLLAMLAGCGGKEAVEEEKTEETLPSGVEFITSDDPPWGDLGKFIDKDTGCQFYFYEGNSRATMVQIFIEEDGVSIPYCNKH